MTQEQLAESAQLHPTYVAKIEAGDRVPSLEVLHRIAVALEVSLVEMMIVLQAVPHHAATAYGVRESENLEPMLRECTQDQVDLVMDLAAAVKRYHVKRR